MLRRFKTKRNKSREIQVVQSIRFNKKEVGETFFFFEKF